MDEFGNLNNDHQIHIRTQRAAERIAKRHSWITANNRHFDHLRQASEDCKYILESMQEWSWNRYVVLLGLKGYDVRERRDSKGILHGYTLRKGNVIIKASELRGRAFMVSRLEDTWRKLIAQRRTDTTTQRTTRITTATSTGTVRTTAHQSQPTPQQLHRASSSTSQSSVQPSAPQVVAGAVQLPAPTQKPNFATLIDYTRYRPNTIPYTLENDEREQRYYIPEKVMDLFNDEFDYREVANWQNLTNLAVALFIGMARGSVTAPSNGGGIPRLTIITGATTKMKTTFAGHVAAPKPLHKNSANRAIMDYEDS